MTTPTSKHESITLWGLLGIGVLLLVVAIFLDPFGPSPDSGLVDLSPTGTRWILGGCGAGFLFGAAWTFFKIDRSG
ncbi:MAG: hypothetical protein ABIN56_03465 [Dokdonella sp.]